MTTVGEERKQRDLIAAELVATERSYVRDLGTLVETFLQPLQQASVEGKPIISDVEISSIFSISDQLKVLNSKLLMDLEGDAATQYSRIGTLFSAFIPYLKM